MINKIKWIFRGIVAVVLIILGITVAIQRHQINELDSNLSYASANQKALLKVNEDNMGEIRSLQLKVEQLDYFNDSILQKLNKAKNELKVKDADLKELQYLKTLATKSDTVFISDTIFVENTNVDTVIQDEWHKTEISLCYPNEIIVTPEFISEKTIVTYIKKETVDPPKKCWLARLFQKKHKVLVVNIKENNPYITTQEYQHVEIIK